jgi:hypothetical protein
LGRCFCSKRQKDQVDDLYNYSCTGWALYWLQYVCADCFVWHLLVVGLLHPHYSLTAHLSSIFRHQASLSWCCKT